MTGGLCGASELSNDVIQFVMKLSQLLGDDCIMVLCCLFLWLCCICFVLFCFVLFVCLFVLFCFFLTLDHNKLMIFDVWNHQLLCQHRT